MTSFDRPDRLDDRVIRALDELAVPVRPDYLDDIFTVTAHTRQRPRWTFPERWLPMQIASQPVVAGPRVPVRPVLLLIVLGLAAAIAGTILVASQRRVPAPFGPADNGNIAYSAGDELWVRESLTATPRLLVGGPNQQASPFFSPDGQHLAYTSAIANGVDRYFLADADGSNARQVAIVPPGDAVAAWAPDSRTMALIYQRPAGPQLSFVSIDGSPDRVIDLAGLAPLDVSWQPPDGTELLVRARDPHGAVDLYAVRPDGSGLRPLGLPGHSAFGAGWTNSGATFSPDGRTIAYNAIILDHATFDTVFRVHLLNADGTGDRALPDPRDTRIQEGWPLYSPDGRSILVHRWTWNATGDGEGWVAVMPADGSAAAYDIGPRIAGGEDTGITKTWSPDGSRVLIHAGNTDQVFSVDPMTGDYELLDWTSTLPDWQRTIR